MNCSISCVTMSPPGMRIPLAVHPDLERKRVGHRRELALDRHAVAPALAADRPLPIDREHLALDLGSGRMPVANVAPTSAPMLVPTTQSTGMRSSSRTRSTPMCAAPFAPPPASTRPILGRDVAVAGASCAAAIPQSGPSNASAAASDSQLREVMKVLRSVAFCALDR